MSQWFKIDGVEYDIFNFSPDGRECIERLIFIQLKVQEIKNNLALLAKAKNGYIEDMKTEIIQDRTGVDFSDLFSDD